MSIVIAGERSGVGKTTVTLALLSYLRRQGWQVQSFKVGPDYIDPMFHSAVTGCPCHNLDPVLTSESYVKQCFATHSRTADYVLVEGVMGLFDGATEGIKNEKLKMKSWEDENQSGLGFGSTAHVARLLDVPVVLVVDCSRLSYSVAAIVHGYRSLDPALQFAGVVLNRVGSDRHLDLLQSALEPLKIPILGVLRRHDSIQIPARHLGLVPTAELAHFQTLIDQLADLAAEWFDWEQLLPLVKGRVAVCGDTTVATNRHSSLRIAIAHDAAFSFYYADNLELLEALGAELVFWSPLKDAELPSGVRGLYLGGGFPEMFVQELAANQVARTAVHQAIQAGMPTYAECGGLMYLCQSLTDFTGQNFPMVGILPTTAVMEKRLTLGYRHAIAQHPSPLVSAGDILWGHEFHHSHLTVEPENPLFILKDQEKGSQESGVRSQNVKLSTANPKSKIQNPKSYEGWHLPNLHASYIHLHWGDRPEMPQRFLDHCRKFQP